MKTAPVNSIVGPFSLREKDERRIIAGVSLIELVVVITITGIIAAILGTFIVKPIQGYEAQVRRAELVDAAEMALRRTARDIRLALPNSVRVTTAGGRSMIEMLNTVDGARYREGPGTNPGGHNHADPKFRLKINSSDNEFNIVGFFQNITASSPQYRLAIYNQGVSGANAYDDASGDLSQARVITNPAYTTFTISKDGDGFDDEDHILLSTNFKFRWASPNQRVFIVDSPITYICNPGSNGTIIRYRSYTISATQPTDPAAAPLTGGSSALLTTRVSACTFSYSPGTNQRAGLVTLDITIADTATNEQVRLLHQVHVDNSP
jgi:MSHA biogenesis protein MshO